MNKLEEIVDASNFLRLIELHDTASNACELLKAMSNKWRLMILCQLSEGEKTVGELQGILGIGQSAVSQHLAVLKREKVVDCKKDAQSIIYFLSGDKAIKVMNTLHDVFCGDTDPND